MMNLQTNRASSAEVITTAAQMQMMGSELEEALDSIGQLRRALSQFALHLDGESIETVTVSQAVLARLSNTIICIFADQNTRNYQTQLHNWDNEGGRIDHASV